MILQFARQAGFSEEQWQQALVVWQAQEVRVPRQQRLLHPGDEVRDIYVVQSGRLMVVEEDYWGNRSLLSEVPAGHMFGAAHVFAGCRTYPIGVEAVQDSVVVRIAYAAIEASATTHPALYRQAMQGFLHAIARRSVGLLHTIEQVKQRTTRQKILAYLSHEAREQGSERVHIAFTRQQMADYLAVDRAAMCRELALLQQEGLLWYKKQQFILFLPNPY